MARKRNGQQGEQDERMEAAQAAEEQAVMSGQPVDVEDLREIADTSDQPAQEDSTEASGTVQEPQATGEAPTTSVIERYCECGCGTPLKGKTSRFAPGHDARHHGRLLAEYDAGNLDAGAELVQRGWRTQADLEVRKDKAAAKQAGSNGTKKERLVARIERTKAELARLEQQLAEIEG